MEKVINGRRGRCDGRVMETSQCDMSASSNTQGQDDVITGRFFVWLGE